MASYWKEGRAKLLGLTEIFSLLLLYHIALQCLAFPGNLRISLLIITFSTIKHILTSN